jgi:gliding motility-associated-like protein
MRKLVVLISFFIELQQCVAQQYNTWYFGAGAGLSFNAGGTSLPYALTDGINDINEGNASISDENGNILFYVNGITVFNRIHQVMLNGGNLMGNASAVQSSLIIPVPGNDSIYYIFTADAVENNFANGYRYSIVNIKHDGGKGEVVTKNILLNGSSTERLTAARHANGIDVWIIGNERNSNVFKAWLMTCTGLQGTPVTSTVGIVMNDEGLGMMKVSPDGSLLCQTNYPDFTGNIFQLFDFDNAIGILSNPRVISNPGTIYLNCEFSPDSKLLYVTRGTNSFIDQFETKLGSAAAINASRVSIPAIYGFYGIQTGPDEKIYLNRHTTKLSVISYPNVKGIGCTFELEKIDLGNRNGVLGLPSAINDGPVDPNNNFSFRVIDSCNGIIQFNGYTNMGGAIVWSWDFGDGTTSALQNPQHTFTPYNQLYHVKLTVKSPTACGYVEKSKSIAPGGAVAKANFEFVSKCDSGYVRFINKSIIYPPDSTIQFTWDFGDGNTSSARDPVYSYASSGIFPVKLKIKTGMACLDDSISKNLDLQQLDIHAPPAQTIDAGQSVQLFVTGGGSSFQWSPARWLDNPAIANPVTKPQEDITYVITATNDAGCKDVDSVFIHVNAIDGIYMPTAFTPGNDGLNDIIKPAVGFRFTLKEFSIFNRWGQKLFSTAERDKGWDGKLSGRLQSTGSYVWIIKVTDEQKKIIEKKGTFLLIR